MRKSKKYKPAWMCLSRNIRIKMKKLLVLFILTILVTLPTFAAEWIQIHEKMYIDIDSIAQYVDDYGNEVPNQYIYWAKVLNDGGSDFKDIEKICNKKVWFVMYKNVMDINKKLIKAKASIIYDLKGNVIDFRSYSDFKTQWHDIVPDTITNDEYIIIRGVLQFGKNYTIKCFKGK